MLSENFDDDFEQNPVTDHLTTRCQQRGVRNLGVQTALDYGRTTPWFHNAILYYLGYRELMQAVATDPTLRHSVDQLNGTAVIVKCGSGQLLTTFKEPRGIRQIARNYGGLARNREK